MKEENNQPAITHEQLNALISDQIRLNFLDTCMQHANLGKPEGQHLGFMFKFSNVFKSLQLAAKGGGTVRQVLDAAMNSHTAEVNAPFMTEEQLEEALGRVDTSLDATKIDTKLLQERREKYEEALATKKLIPAKKRAGNSSKVR